MNSTICCPACGATLEVEARVHQPEFPGFFTEIEIFPKKKLVVRQPESLKSDEPITIPSFPNKNSARNETKIESESEVASCEEDLIGIVRRIVGEKEWERYGHRWTFYSRHEPKALAYAVEDWKLRTPDQKRTIKNSAAWLTDRYKRALNELRKSA